MGAPRLSEEAEGARSGIVDELDERALRKDAALEQVAHAVSVICDVPTAHVSLMETDKQCVVGHVGFETARFDRDKTFCAHTVADQEVLIVEDATDDERFEDNPFVLEDPGISFYVGLPIIVEGVPVGTVCAIDYEARELELDQRGELFGLVNAIESHLDIVHRHGARSPEHGVSSKLTSIRAISTRERVRHNGVEGLGKALAELEEETGEASEMLVASPTADEVRLGVASTEVEEE